MRKSNEPHIRYQSLRGTIVFHALYFFHIFRNSSFVFSKMVPVYCFRTRRLRIRQNMVF